MNSFPVNYSEDIVTDNTVVRLKFISVGHHHPLHVLQHFFQNICNRSSKSFISQMGNPVNVKNVPFYVLICASLNYNQICTSKWMASLEFVV